MHHSFLTPRVLVIWFRPWFLSHSCLDDPQSLKCIFLGYSWTQKRFKWFCYKPTSFVFADVTSNHNLLFCLRIIRLSKRNLFPMLIFYFFFSINYPIIVCYTYRIVETIQCLVSCTTSLNLLAHIEEFCNQASTMSHSSDHLVESPI